MVSFNALLSQLSALSNNRAELIHCVGGYANAASFPEED
jgi:hypothetical protein